MPNHTMHAHTVFLLVTLSYLIAATSAYIAIELAGRVKTATDRSKHFWLIAGSSILGLGIWSMLFSKKRFEMNKKYNFSNYELSLAKWTV